jgi:aspartyl-tRNA(Asn)/glutamyl-tRNA(Gln) amidotransferase subunit A
VLSGAAFDLATPADAGYFTRAINYLGLPALALPCGKSGGLPLGFQLVGRPNADENLLGLGQTFEELPKN